MLISTFSCEQMFSVEDAIKIAAEMNASDDWEYTPVHDPKGTGLSYIAIHDEDGEFVGKL